MTDVGFPGTGRSGRGAVARPRVVLHVGCGAPNPETLHRVFRGPAWREVRLDIDPAAAPDITASITDMVGVESGAYDAVYSSHNIEHLFAHEVPLAIGEFVRVLRPDGFALIHCPDLQSVAALVAADKLEDTAYVSPAGPIAPLDMIYGLRGAVARGKTAMAHRTGFTLKTLGSALIAGGFARAVVERDEPAYALKAIGFRTAPSDAEMKSFRDALFPAAR